MVAWLRWTRCPFTIGKGATADLATDFESAVDGETDRFRMAHHLRVFDYCESSTVNKASRRDAFYRFRMPGRARPPYGKH